MRYRWAQRRVARGIVIGDACDDLLAALCRGVDLGAGGAVGPRIVETGLVQSHRVGSSDEKLVCGLEADVDRRKCPRRVAPSGAVIVLARISRQVAGWGRKNHGALGKEALTLVV